MPTKPRAKRPAKRMTRANSIRVPKNQVDPTKESKKMSRTADFSGVSDYQAINGGQYELGFESYEWKDPKEIKDSNRNPATGKAYQYASLKWVVRDETDGEGNEVAGKVVYDTISENPKSLFMLKRVAIMCGEDPDIFEPDVDDDGKKLPLQLDLDEIYGRMVGRTVLATVVVEDYTKPDGTHRISNKITKYEAVEQETALSAARR